jgi:hypothetical protein
LIKSIEAFDRYAKDFYPFLAAKLKITADPPLTKVLIVSDPKEQEDWKTLRDFVARMGGSPEGLKWSRAKAVQWIMPENRDERLELSQTKPEAMPDAAVDYDAFICLSASRMYADAKQAHAELNTDLTTEALYTVEVYHAMSSACIQLLGMRGYGIAGIGTVVGVDEQALPLMNEFRRKIPIEIRRKIRPPNRGLTDDHF